MDSAGDQHLHIDHNIYKRRVDLQGNPIEEAKKEDISVPSTKKPEPAVCIRFYWTFYYFILYFVVPKRDKDLSISFFFYS